jgi:hypothetical protein
MFDGNQQKANSDFPSGFQRQKIGVGEAIAMSDLSPSEIVAYFRKEPDTAERLLSESYDKRCSPSTFITEVTDGYSVGWFSSESGPQCERRFSNLADAATDYLLFSLGKGRWTPSKD